VKGNITVCNDVCLSYRVREMLLYTVKCLGYLVRDILLCTLMCV